MRDPSTPRPAGAALGTGPWRIELLGGLRASRGGALHERFRTRKTAALLGWLALHAGRRLTRDALVEMLWPGREPEAGRNGLSKALSALRAQLEPPDIQAGSVLAADRESVRLEAAAVVTDVRELEAALARAQAAEAAEAVEAAGAGAGSGDDGPRRRALEEALALSRGELLPGHDQPELRAPRERLLEAAVRAAIALADLDAERDPARALEAARRAVALAPLHEGAHRTLLRLLGTGGEPAAAARAYRALERRLEEDVGAPPSALTQAVARRIARDALPAATPGTGASSEARRDPEPEARSPEPATLAAPARARGVVLPLELSRFVGREEETARVVEALGSGAHRLLTITGPGGIGKTRLALEAARRLSAEMPGGVRFTGLADLAEARLLPRAALASLGIEPRPGEDPLERLTAALAGERSLLVLDNAEHLLPSGAAALERGDAASSPSLPDLVRALLERAPGLACLVTSRRTLGVSGEREEPLAPLETPPEGETRPGALQALPSVRLFVERARRARPRFSLDGENAAAVAAIVRRVEGIPLAIALAAGRSHALAPAEILARLDAAGRLDLPAARERDTAPRHRTLRAAIDASHALLSPAQRGLFARLAVFRGGFSLAAAEEVCREPLALDLLCDLRECSLVSSEDRGARTRFRMLETIREYAAESLPPGERAPLEARHFAWALALAERHGEAARAGSREAAAAIETEHENLRAALDHAAEDGAAAGAATASRVAASPTEPAAKAHVTLEAGARLAAALAPFWDIRGHWAEAERRIAGFLGRLPAPGGARAALLRQAGNLARRRGDLRAARASLEESVAIERALGASATLGAALGALGAVLLAAGDRAAARPLLEESGDLLRRLDPGRAGAPALQLGLLAHADGDLAAARARFSEAADAFAASGDRASAAFAGVNAAVTAAETGAIEEAGRRMQEAVATFRALGNEPGIAGALLRYGAALRAAGRPAEARPPLEDALARSERLGARQEAAFARVYLGALTAEEGRGTAEGRALVERGLAELRTLGQERGIALAEGILAKLRGL